VPALRPALWASAPEGRGHRLEAPLDLRRCPPGRCGADHPGGARAVAEIDRRSIRRSAGDHDRLDPDRLDPAAAPGPSPGPEAVRRGTGREHSCSPAIALPAAGGVTSPGGGHRRAGGADCPAGAGQYRRRTPTFCPSVGQCSSRTQQYGTGTPGPAPRRGGRGGFAPAGVVPGGHRSGRGVRRPALSRYVATESPMTLARRLVAKATPRLMSLKRPRAAGHVSDLSRAATERLRERTARPGARESIRAASTASSRGPN
jgi:hypothetical protein